MTTALALLGRFLLRVLRWTVVGVMPPLKKAVAIGAPHTSAWDAVLLFAAGHALRVPMRWMGKHTLFQGPLGPLYRALGGFPIDRSHSFGTVDQVVAEFNRRDEMILVLSPEGTRRRVSRWKRGFYEIARRVDVPVILCTPDYARRELIIGPVVHLTGDVEADMDVIRAFYQGRTGKHPERVGPVVVAGERRN